MVKFVARANWYWYRSMVEFELESSEPKDLAEFPKSIMKIRKGLARLVKKQTLERRPCGA